MSPEVMMKLVRDKPGIKGTELLCDYIENIRGAGLEPEPGEQLIDMLNTLVKKGDLVEVEYVLPDMDYRIKSLYFPKGTEVKLVGDQKVDRYAYACDRFGHYTLTDHGTNQSRYINGDDATDFRNKLYPTEGPTPQLQALIAEYFN